MKKGGVPILSALLLLFFGLAMAGGVFVANSRTGFLSSASSWVGLPAGSSWRPTVTLRPPIPSAVPLSCKSDGDCPNFNKDVCRRISGIKCPEVESGFVFKCVNERCEPTRASASATIPPPSGSGDLGLKVVPSLASQMGRVDLKLEWSSEFVSKNKISQVDVSVYLENNGRIERVIKQINLSAVSETEINSLPVNSGSSYGIGVRAKSKDNKYFVSRAKFGYFEDKFDGPALNSLWIKDAEDVGEEVTFVGGRLVVKDQFSDENGDSDNTKIYLNIVPGTTYETQVELIDNEPESKDLSRALLAATYDQNESVFDVEEYSGLNVRRITARKNEKSDFEPNADEFYKSFATVSYPALFSINSISGKINGEEVMDSSIKVGQTSSIVLGVVQNGEMPKITAVFDNFRLVWVK